MVVQRTLATDIAELLQLEVRAEEQQINQIHLPLALVKLLHEAMAAPQAVQLPET